MSICPVCASVQLWTDIYGCTTIANHFISTPKSSAFAVPTGLQPESTGFSFAHQDGVE